MSEDFNRLEFEIAVDRAALATLFEIYREAEGEIKSAACEAIVVVCDRVDRMIERKLKRARLIWNRPQ
jgi:hypothetical protein